MTIPRIVTSIGLATPIRLWLDSGWIGGEPYTATERDHINACISLVLKDLASTIGPLALPPDDEQTPIAVAAARAYSTAHPDHAVQLTRAQYARWTMQSHNCCLHISMTDMEQRSQKRQQYYQNSRDFARVYLLQRLRAPLAAQCYWTNYEPYLPARIARSLHTTIARARVL